jgi:hypothetical protein
MGKMKYGCYNRKPFHNYYHATGGEKTIPHVLTTDCQYRLTELGKSDPKCTGCKHKDVK